MSLPEPSRRRRWQIGLGVAGVAAAVRLLWVLCVPTIVVGDFATYRESAAYMSEHGRLDDGFIYMPGLVLLLAAIERLGGEVLAGKMLGVAFGAISAGALYVATSALEAGESSASPSPSQSPGLGNPSSLLKRVAAAVLSPAGIVVVLYALWLPGIAMASVIGTDVPCAAMICVALAFLLDWGPTRPRAAAVAFGAAMGVAAYFRAVALPLVALSTVYWATSRTSPPPRQVVSRALLSVAVTLLVLSPWAIRNLEVDGRLSFTDSHGGITALMGNDPNTAGTYSRALSARFQQLTGKTFLSRPHRATDAAAYDIAKGWIAFQPAWTLGMVALRLERLLAPERGLLYWSVFRPGILPDPAMLWFNMNRRWITRATDGYAFMLVLGLCAGIAFAIAERRWAVLFPLGVAIALLATYALFVAEPRYRLTSEIVVFPTLAWGLSRFARAIRHARTSLRGLVGTGLTLLAVVAAAISIAAGGGMLRERFRWAVSVSTVDGLAAQTFWRTAPGDPGPSRVQGTTDGVAIRGFARPAPSGDAIVEMILPRVPPREALPLANALQYSFRVGLDWAKPNDGGKATLSLSAPGALVPFAHADLGDRALAGTVAADLLADPRHPRQVLVLARLHVVSADPTTVDSEVRLSTVEITATPIPSPGQSPSAR